MSSMSARSPTFRVVPAVARVTFTEILREKILYSIAMFGLLLLALAFLTSKLTFVLPERIILDFGLSAIQICCALMAMLLGANLIGKEFERRTILVAFSRPISRIQFLLGKFAGLGAIIFLNWFLLSGLYLLILRLVSENRYHWSPILAWALLFALLESLVFGALVIMVACLSTATVAVMISIGIYLVGTNISQVRLVAAKMGQSIGALVLNAFALVFPNLEYFHLGTKVTYDLPIATQWVFAAVIYALLWIAFCLGLAGVLIQRKET